MNRYIDAELLLTDNTYEWFDDWGNYTSAGQAIVDAPTADVVEVVRCKDCAMHSKCTMEDTFITVGITDGYCRVGRKVEK